MSAIRLRCLRSRCWTTITAAARSAGRPETIWVSAPRPPADAPMPITSNVPGFRGDRRQSLRDRAESFMLIMPILGELAVSRDLARTRQYDLPDVVALLRHLYRGRGKSRREGFMARSLSAMREPP